MKKIGVIIFGLLITSFLNNQCSAANQKSKCKGRWKTNRDKNR